MKTTKKIIKAILITTLTILALIAYGKINGNADLDEFIEVNSEVAPAKLYSPRSML